MADRVLVREEGEPYYFLHEGQKGTRQLWVYDQDHGYVLGLRVEKGRLYIGATWLWDGGEVPPEDLAPWLHAHQDRFAQAGFNLRRWWHLWACRDCGAPPLGRCRNHRTGKPIKYGHKGRNPRRARLEL